MARYDGKPRAHLEIQFVLGDTTSRAFTTWTYRTMGGGTVRHRRRYSGVDVGMDSMPGLCDGQQVLTLLEALADEMFSTDGLAPPAPPEGGHGGEHEIVTKDYGQMSLDLVYDQNARAVGKPLSRVARPSGQ